MTLRVCTAESGYSFEPSTFKRFCRLEALAIRLEPKTLAHWSQPSPLKTAKRQYTLSNCERERERPA